ncbi:DUF1311 domain-containing protein [Burkholderia contaminans]|uniref:lysozyme inhibitor LprI family protein n=1 Tax=Burkholderia contaminans TaxID=488447 RepID=UPI001CF10E26|nr:lysozyme inhibitor LprI family protein [Burkholderia contaminans]MCA7915845.1 DUF1311 domain-containing protein [Burkholderia contaminans]UUX40755.1 DUF1311 domain-containing protein [Burkholderia contaminans]
MSFTRLVVSTLAGFCALFSANALAESTLHLEVEAVHVDENSPRVSLLVKVTDTIADKDSFGRIIGTSLPARGSCVARFDGDEQNVVGPCAAVHVQENGSPVKAVKVRILDTRGNHNWMVLTWNSIFVLPPSQRSVKMIVGVANGWYSDNPEEIFQLAVLPSFDPARPYNWLYQRADRALNDNYRRILARYAQKNDGNQARGLRVEERIWVDHKESECRDSGEPERCRWLATEDRLDSILEVNDD